MEQIAQKTKRNQTNPGVTKTYTVKVSKSQQKSKTAEQVIASKKTDVSKPAAPSKTDSHAFNNQKCKKLNENQPVKTKHSTSPAYSNTVQAKNSRNKNETYSPAKLHNNNLIPNHRNYSSSTQPSENDSEKSEGFKIVQNGKIILNSLLSDSETESQENSSGSETNAPKISRFATSLCNIGPSCNKISLPEFLMGY